MAYILDMIDEKRIRELLAATGLTQAELAKMVGVTQPTVSRWLTGSIPDPGQQVAIQRVMDGYAAPKSAGAEHRAAEAVISANAEASQSTVPRLSALSADFSQEVAAALKISPQQFSALLETLDEIALLNASPEFLGSDPQIRREMVRIAAVKNYQKSAS